MSTLPHAPNRRAWLRGATAAALGYALRPSTVFAQAGDRSVGDWPARPIHFIVGYPAGGLTDALARAYGDVIGQALRQTILVDNRAGAGGMTAGGEVAKAPPDGYTFWVTISAPLIQNRVYFRKLPYDPDNDFVHVAAVPTGHLVMAVPADSKVRRLEDLAAIATTGHISLGNFGAGTWGHMLTHELALHHRWNADPVPYKGEAPMWQDLAGGQLDAAVGSYFGVQPFLQSGRLRPIAVQTRVRSALLPDVPTFVERGYTERVFELDGWIGFLAPRGTSPEIVRRMSDLFLRAATDPRVRQLHERFGLGVTMGAADFERARREMQPHWIKLARDLNLEPQ